MFPKTGPLWKQTSISRALRGISFRVPSKGALPPGSPYRVPTERCSISRVLLHSSFKVPGIGAPFQVPQSYTSTPLFAFTASCRVNFAFEHACSS